MNLIEWLSLGVDAVTVLMMLLLWRSYRRPQPVAPPMYLFAACCSLLFLGVYVYAMPAGDYVTQAPFAGPAAALGLLWGLAASRGMRLFKAQGRHFLQGSLWMPVWATLNFISGKLLEAFGTGLWGVGGLALMIIATMATVAANVVLLVTLVRVKRQYEGAPRAGGKLHFCHSCGTGYERSGRRCPVCRERKARLA